MILSSLLLDEPFIQSLIFIGDMMLKKSTPQVVILPHSNLLLVHYKSHPCLWATPTLFLNFKPAPPTFYKTKFLLSQMALLMIFQSKALLLDTKMSKGTQRPYQAILAFEDLSGNTLMMSIALCTV